MNNVEVCVKVPSFFDRILSTPSPFPAQELDLQSDVILLFTSLGWSTNQRNWTVGKGKSTRREATPATPRT